MKILSIGSDRTIFRENSEARKRIIEYAGKFDELHVVVFSKRNRGEKEMKNQEFKNVFLYPTNSLSKFFYVFSAYGISKKILDKKNNFILTVQDPFESGLAGLLLKMKFKLPFQIQIHTDFLSPYFKKESLLNKIRVLLASFAVKRADCVRVVSERIKKSIMEKYGLAENKIVNLPIFVDIDEISKEPKTQDLREKYPLFKFIILIASRITKEKNIEIAVSAMSEVIKKYPETGLVIVGDGPEKKFLLKKVSNLRLQNTVVFENKIPHKTLISYYKTADLFVFVSNYEGYGRSVVEAMAAGCPVIMTDVGLAGEILVDKKDGIVVPVGGAERLKESILTLMENKDLRDNLVKNAQDVFKFRPSKEIYLADYYDSLAAC